MNNFQKTYKMLEDEFINLSYSVALTKENMQTSSIRIIDLIIRCGVEIEYLLSDIYDQLYNETTQVGWGREKEEFLMSTLTSDQYEYYERLKEDSKNKEFVYNLISFPKFKWLYKKINTFFVLDTKKIRLIEGGFVNDINPFKKESQYNGQFTWQFYYNTCKHDKEKVLINEAAQYEPMKALIDILAALYMLNVFRITLNYKDSSGKFSFFNTSLMRGFGSTDFPHRNAYSTPIESFQNAINVVLPKSSIFFLSYNIPVDSMYAYGVHVFSDGNEEIKQSCIFTFNEFDITKNQLIFFKLNNTQNI